MREAPQTRSRTEWLVAALFALTGMTGVALLVLYVLGGQTQLEGILLAVALGSLGIGVVLWAQDLMITPVVVEERQPQASASTGSAELSDVLDEEAGFA